jgi:hypothetical protein
LTIDEAGRPEPGSDGVGKDKPPVHVTRLLVVAMIASILGRHGLFADVVTAQVHTPEK